MILVWGKARSYRAPNLGCRGAESPELFDISREKLCTSCDTWTVALSRWSCQSPVAYSCGLLNQLNSFPEECSSLTQNLMQICCSTRSVILNVMATQYTCSLSGIYHPHWLVQWSCHCSHMCIPVHSPWLPGYINVTQTVLVILTWLGFIWTDIIYISSGIWICH